MKALLFLAVLVVGSIGLMLQGDFGTAAIVLLVIGMVVAIALSPFAAMSREDRRAARLAATALVLAGWATAGALLWEWAGADYAVAGVVAAIALAKAAQVPAAPAPSEQPLQGS